MNNKPQTLEEQFEAERLDQIENMKQSALPKAAVPEALPQFGNPDRKSYEESMKIIKARKNKEPKEPSKRGRKNKQTENFKILGKIDNLNNK